MRKKSENRSSIIKPLHFGHSIDSSPVATFTAVGGIKQELHQFVTHHDFNELCCTYLSQELKKADLAGTKTSALSCFVQERANVGDQSPRVLDHLIIVDGRSVSFANEGWLKIGRGLTGWRTIRSQKRKGSR